jgi:NADH:ubiquinone oxidoreductase subunit K
MNEAASSFVSALPLAMAPEYWLFGGAGLISLIAFAGLILAPALGAYGRAWEKAAATVLSLFVLIALIAIGVAIGVAIVYYWNDIIDWFGG